MQEEFKLKKNIAFINLIFWKGSTRIPLFDVSAEFIDLAEKHCKSSGAE